MRPGRGTFILEKIRGKRNDIYASQSIKEFTESLSQAILQQIPEQKSIGKRFLDLLKGFHPILSYDALTGQPEISFEFTEQKGAEKTLAAIFQFLETQDRRILIAIDEFQQIANYPETNTEALLRSYIQQLKNFLLTWTRTHTYYTQTLCNHLYASSLKRIQEEDVRNICSDLLSSQQATYIQYRRLLSPVQWQLLIAIAKEERVFQPQSKAFLAKYKIGTPANSKRALEALLDKEMIFKEEDLRNSWYQVYDVFLSDGCN